MVCSPAISVQRFDFETTMLGSGNVSRNWGPTLRGGFGQSLRKVACSLGRDSCTDCFLVPSCAYGYIFETPIPESTAIMRSTQRRRIRSSFEPNDQQNAAVKAGEASSHSVVVIGEAIRYLPHVFLALEELGKRGLGRDLVPFQVESVRVHGGDFVYQRGDRRFRDFECRTLSLEPGESRTTRFTLELRTPTRIVVDGKLASSPTLCDLVRAMSRRLFLLRYFHCGGSLDLLSTAFVAAAADARCVHQEFSWSEASRYSTRQSRQVPIGGIIGRATYEGDLGLLRPLLAAGNSCMWARTPRLALAGSRCVKEHQVERPRNGTRRSAARHRQVCPTRI